MGEKEGAEQAHEKARNDRGSLATLLSRGRCRRRRQVVVVDDLCVGDERAFEHLRERNRRLDVAECVQLKRGRRKVSFEIKREARSKENAQRTGGTGLMAGFGPLGRDRCCGSGAVLFLGRIKTSPRFQRTE